MILRTREGETYTLRQVSETDAKTLHDFLMEIVDDPSSFITVNYLGEVRSEEEIREFIKRLNVQNSLQLLAFSNTELMGTVQLSVAPIFGPKIQFHEGMLAYSIKKEFRGRGLSYPMVYSVLRSSGVKYVSAYVDVLNQPSIKVLEGLGLERLALIKEGLYKVTEGKFHDLLLYRGETGAILERARQKMRERGLEFIGES